MGSVSPKFSSGFLQLLLILISSFSASSETGAPTVIRITCGSSENSHSPQGALWLKDYGFSGGKIARNTAENTLAPQSRTLRYFDMSDGPENCYNVTLPDGHYLVRFLFTFGALDNSDLEPQFDVSIEGTLVYSLNSGWSRDRSSSYADSLAFVEDGALATCFHSSGHGNPAIAALEILQLPDGAYELGRPWSHHIVQKMVKRVNCGGGENSTGYESDWNGDPWGGDRYWESDEALEKGKTGSSSTSERITGALASPNFYPEVIYQTASTTATGVSVSYSFSVEPGQNYSLWFHFAEISPGISAREQRVFDILVNGELVFLDVDIIAMAGAKFTAVVLNKTVLVEGKTMVITFRPVQGSVLVNAFEVYQVIRTEFTTDTKQVWALQALKRSLALPARIGWNGDPCIPQEHPWNGINCGFHFDRGGWFIDGLDLDNQGLKGYIPNDIAFLVNLQSINLSGNSLYGTIPPEIGNLTSLSILDLSFNFLNGSIPASFGKLPRLRKLFLNGNQLSGQVPPILLAGPVHGASFNFSDNLDLCGIPGVRPCGFTLSSGAKAGLGFASFLVILVVSTCGYCLWKRRQNIARAHRLSTSRSAAYAKARTQFTRDIQLSKMHRIDDLGSPYRDTDNG